MSFRYLRLKPCNMENTNSFETFLWFVVGFIGSGMAALLIIGWLKGMHWQREMKTKRRHSHH